MSQPITAAAVNELRKRTDLPMMECKAALQEAGGDMDKAIEIIRVRFKGVAAKRAMNETAEGRIAVYIDPLSKVAAILEMRCESAPVVKSEQFIKLADDLARHVALKNPKSVEELVADKEVTERINEVIGLIRENMKPARFTRINGDLFSQYVHHDGSIGVLLHATGPDSQGVALRDACMHIAAVQPTPAAVRREDVSPELLAKEKQIAQAKAEATGKPPQIAEKIAEGQMKTWYGENVLLEQPFIKDPSKTVGQMLKAAGLDVVSFVRYKLGEVVK